MEESKVTLQERLAAARQELAGVKQSNDEVKSKVAAQRVQLPEFQRMMGERRAREEKLRGVQNEIEEVQREKWQMEVGVTREGKALPGRRQELRRVCHQVSHQGMHRVCHQVRLLCHLVVRPCCRLLPCSSSCLLHQRRSSHLSQHEAQAHLITAPPRSPGVREEV